MAEDLQSIILRQLDLHDGLTVQDMYKLIHQAVFGVHHLLHDEEAAHRALKEEFEELGSALPGEALLEMIDPQGIVHRLNLRPYRSKGGTPERLWEAVLLTRDGIKGTTSEFTFLWNEARRLVKLGAIPFTLRDLEVFETEVMGNGHPIVHHSESYRRANRPAYRLIAVRFLETIGRV
jgi:hypothetical protein